MLFKLSNLNSNLALTPGYLNPALNNSALALTPYVRVEFVVGSLPSSERFFLWVNSGFLHDCSKSNISSKFQFN